MATDLSKTRRLELILRQIDSLPTLPVVATRLLSLTASDESDARQVTGLIMGDQTLTAKVLSLCRQSDRGVRSDVMTIDKAVVLLGFTAVRNAVLSIKVFETFDPRESREGEKPDGFDRVDFWRHSLAVGIAAELIAAAHGAPADLPPAEAFVAGLLHDIGKVALDHVLPKSFARVIELTDLNQGNIAEFERRIIGLDHHTAGKRIAEQWQLPHRLQDCVWLHGSAYEALPRLDHRRLIGLIGLSDLIVRQQHIGYSGNFQLKQEPRELAEKLALDPQRIERVSQRLHEEVEKRARALGLEDRPSRDLYLQSIEQANQVLGRLNSALERRSRGMTKQAQVLDAIGAFHAAAQPGRSMLDVMNLVVSNASEALGEGFYALLQQSDERGQPWFIAQYGADGQPLRSQYIEPPPHAPDLTRLGEGEPVSMNLMQILPWISDYLLEAPDLREVKLLPLSCGWGTAGVLLHNQAQLPPWAQLSALLSTWGAAIAAAGQHDGARRMGEELADANRALAEAQDKLLQSESMARLGEMAAGAAHEMNNPLAVISGRSQLLSISLTPGTKEQKAAQTIFEQAHRLSDLITSLRMFADPPRADPKPTDIGTLLQEAIKRVHKEQGAADKPVNLQIKSKLPPVSLDAEQIQKAITELIENGLQASPRSGVHVTARVEPVERHLIVQVSDDGTGMDGHTLAHAMDPFFSNKTAGRRVGMGLPRAQQLAAAHGGWIELRSKVGEGTTASLFLPLDEVDFEAADTTAA